MAIGTRYGNTTGRTYSEMVQRPLAIEEGLPVLRTNNLAPTIWNGPLSTLEGGLARRHFVHVRFRSDVPVVSIVRNFITKACYILRDFTQRGFVVHNTGKFDSLIRVLFSLQGAEPLYHSTGRCILFPAMCDVLPPLNPKWRSI